MGSDNVILITGTSTGIGYYLTEYFLNKGNFVVGCSRSEATVNHSRYRHHRLDVSSEPEVKDLMRQVRKEFGRLDVLINNAGIASMNHFVLTPVETLHKVLNTNVIGMFLFSREAAKLMKKTGGGCIVNFSTVAVPLRLEGEAIYAASKAAVVNLTQVMSKELIEWGIRVNAVGPTPIYTNLIKAVPKDKIDALISQQTIKRLGKFEDVSNVIDFLISPASEFITGQVIYLGGVHQ
jgi:3-oxoacyl-[acyl-carrier protein] reductase